MEFVLGVILSVPFFIGLFVLALLFDHSDARGWSVFFALLLAVAIFFGFRPSLIEIGYVLAGYLPFGIIWSFWRFKRFARRSVEAFNDMYRTAGISSKERERERVLERVAPANNVSRIIYWIMLWPISIIESLLGDLYDSLKLLVTVVFKKTYARIFEKEINKLIS